MAKGQSGDTIKLKPCNFHLLGALAKRVNQGLVVGNETSKRDVRRMHRNVDGSFVGDFSRRRRLPFQA